MATENIPVGKGVSAQVKVVDASGADVTSQCSITPPASTGNVTFQKAGLGLGAYSVGGAAISSNNPGVWSASRGAESLQQTETYNVTAPALAQIIITYGDPQ